MGNAARLLQYGSRVVVSVTLTWAGVQTSCCGSSNSQSGRFESGRGECGQIASAWAVVNSIGNCLCGDWRQQDSITIMAGRNVVAGQGSLSHDWKPVRGSRAQPCPDLVLARLG